MDPLSIYGATNTALTTINTVIQVLQDMKNAKKERQEWKKTLQHVQAYLEQLKGWVEEANLEKSAPWYRGFIKAMGLEDRKLVEGTDLKSLGFWPDSPFGCLESRLKELEKKLKTKSGWYHEVVWRAWHTLNKKEFAPMFTEIEGLQASIQRSLQLDHFALSKVTHGLVREMKEVVTLRWNEADRKDALDRLSNLDFSKKQDQIYATCFQDGLSPPGQWLLTSEEFVAWQAGRPWPLYCYGNPGAGKVCGMVLVASSTATDTK